MSKIGQHGVNILLIKRNICCSPALTAFADQLLIMLKLVYCISDYHAIKTLIYFRE